MFGVLWVDVFEVAAVDNDEKEVFAVDVLFEPLVGGEGQIPDAHSLVFEHEVGADLFVGLDWSFFIHGGFRR